MHAESVSLFLRHPVFRRDILVLYEEERELLITVQTLAQLDFSAYVLGKDIRLETRLVRSARTYVRAHIHTMNEQRAIHGV